MGIDVAAVISLAQRAFLQPSLVLGQEGVEPFAVHLVFDLLGAHEDGEADAGEDAGLALVDADVEERLGEYGLAGGVDLPLVVADDRVRSGPAVYGALGFVVDGDSDAPEDVDALEGSAVFLTCSLSA